MSTPLSPTDLKFGTADGKLWTRRLYGQEAQAAYFVDHGEGFTMYAGTLTARFTPSRSRAELELPIQKAWIRARHLSPSIACRQTKHDGHYWFEYQVPTAAEAQTWAEETVFWHEEPKTLLQTDLMLEDKWWKCSDGLYIVQLHFVSSAETPGDWHIGYLAPHNSIDGRSLMKLLEHILTWTLEELKTPSAGTPELEWGSEPVRLAPTLILAAQLPLDQAPEPKAAPAPPPGFIPFLPAVVDADHTSADEANNVNALLSLTSEETARYRQVCRAHGVTVTDLMLALLALAEIESTLQIALKSDNGELTAKNIGAYEQASHFLFGFYFINHRHKLPGEYATLEDGALLFGCEGTSLLFDMATMRKAILFDKETGTIQRTATDEVLWDGIIKMSNSVAKSTPSDWTAVFQREVDRQFALDEGLHDDTAFHMRVPMMSSIGDYHAMDILNPFVPETGALAKELAILGQCHTIRVTHPLIVPICWQYAGRINFSWSSGRKWLSQENMDLYAGIFKEWLDICIGEL
ncbi:hypothetical protein F5146DRAFT_319228 [Armillaria mellea]|nr:hypothetical protein F5146DRAFT_319228 [Armillaria mellea]